MAPRLWRFFAHEDDFADIDEAGSVRALGPCCRFRTYLGAWMPRRWTGGPSTALRAYMQQAWPHVALRPGEVELYRPFVAVTLSGSERTQPVMLMGHMDVVPVVPGTGGDWTHASLAGTWTTPHIWGRARVGT